MLTAPPSPPVGSVPWRLTDRIFGRPDRVSAAPAVICGERTVDYAVLHDRVRRTAAWLATRAPGTMPAADSRSPGPSTSGAQILVGLLVTDAERFVEVFLAATMTAATSVILEPTWSEAELAGALSQVTPDLFVADPEHHRTVGRLAPDVPVLSPGELAGDSEGTPPPPAAAGGDDREVPLFIGFTSGTSGRPKGYRRSHASWLASLDTAAAELSLAAGEHVLIPGRIHHSMVLWSAVETLAAGATACFLPRFRAADVLAKLRDGGITRIDGVPTMYAAITGAAEPNEQFSSVRTVVSAGAKRSAALDRALHRLFPEAHRIEYYGASELSFVSVSSSRETLSPGSVGRPCRGVEVQVRRADGSAAAAGEVGRLHVRSAMLCSGYLDAGPGTGGPAFRDDDGWATVGDLARLDEAGCLHLMGRESGMLISGGINIYPAEVEAVLLAQPEIAEAVVLGLPDPYWGERVCAVVRWHAGRRLSNAELRARCGQRLARHKLPKALFAVSRFPYTRSGKIAESVLRTWIRVGGSALSQVA